MGSLEKLGDRELQTNRNDRGGYRAADLEGDKRQKQRYDTLPTGSILQICAWCDRVLDRSGRWRNVDEGDRPLSSAPPSHGICPDCVEQLDLGA